MAPSQSNWTLDGTGNWTQVDGEIREHSSFNEITVRDDGTATTLGYDDNGNQTDSGSSGFSWDYRNRLRSATRNSDDAVIAVYTYDASGRRIRKVITNGGIDNDPTLNGTTTFYYDGWRVVEERDVSDDLIQQYVYGIYIDEVLLMDRDLDADNSAVGVGDQRLFYQQNTLYSFFALTDTTGNIVEGYKYDAYGRPTVYQPGTNGVVDFGGDDIITPGGLSAVGNPYLFTGRRYDPETGLYHYRTRYFDAMAGRFITRDFIGTWGEVLNVGNAYSYVGNSPISLLDPLGLQNERRVTDWMDKEYQQQLKELFARQQGKKKIENCGDCFWAGATATSLMRARTAAKADSSQSCSVRKCGAPVKCKEKGDTYHYGRWGDNVSRYSLNASYKCECSAQAPSAPLRPPTTAASDIKNPTDFGTLASLIKGFSQPHVPETKPGRVGGSTILKTLWFIGWALDIVGIYITETEGLPCGKCGVRSPDIQMMTGGAGLLENDVCLRFGRIGAKTYLTGLGSDWGQLLTLDTCSASFLR